MLIDVECLLFIVGRELTGREQWEVGGRGGGGVRCSKRRRFRVLQFWRNERVEVGSQSRLDSMAIAGL